MKILRMMLKLIRPIFPELHDKVLIWTMEGSIKAAREEVRMINVEIARKNSRRSGKKQRTDRKRLEKAKAHLASLESLQESLMALQKMKPVLKQALSAAREARI